MEPVKVSDPRPSSIERSEELTLYSNYVEDEFLIKVWFPDEYDTSGKRFPVLYLTDADYAFAMATDIVQYLIYGNHIPNLVIIGIGYGNKTPVEEGGKNNRGRDFLYKIPPWAVGKWDPSPDRYRASYFVQCLLQEIITTVESRYYIDSSDRTISGYSGGGYFVNHLIFETEGVFRRIIQVDGCLPEEASEMEETYAKTHRDLPLHLFVSTRGNLENDCTYVERLRARGYPSLVLDFCEQNVEGHFAAPADGLTRGLVSVFRGWESSS